MKIEMSEERYLLVSDDLQQNIKTTTRQRLKMSRRFHYGGNLMRHKIPPIRAPTYRAVHE
jgi:hypothetical protein